jgi:hypothetical protein
MGNPLCRPGLLYADHDKLNAAPAGGAEFLDLVAMTGDVGFRKT